MTEAVIFDFDGVIADTMQDNFRAWQMVFENDFKVRIEPLDYFLLEGLGRFEIADFFIRKYNLQPGLAPEIAAKKEANYRDIHQFRLYEEIPEILDVLAQKGIKTGLVTGASRQRITATLPPGFRKYFTAIVTSDDTEKGKPNPEPYLKALETLECNHSNTIVIENAKLGITAAKSAACICWAITTTVDGSYLQEADRVFNNHTELLDNIKHLLK